MLRQQNIQNDFFLKVKTMYVDRFQVKYMFYNLELIQL